jgi:hypothetical protein
MPRKREFQIVITVDGNTYFYVLDLTQDQATGIRLLCEQANTFAYDSLHPQFEMHCLGPAKTEKESDERENSL